MYLDSTNQARAFAFIGLMWGIGGISIFEFF